MAARKKKSGNVRFELAKSAIGGIAVVVFCLFLWTFIFGVWAGQSLLAPQKRGKGEEESSSISVRRDIEIVPVAAEKKSEAPLLYIRADKKAIKKETTGKKRL